MPDGKMETNLPDTEKTDNGTQPTTVGEEAYKRLLNPDDKQGIIDTQREIDKKYFDELAECVKRHKDTPAFQGKDFFVTVIVKKERLMENVIRRYFVARLSLPTPAYDQTVWRYNRKGDLEYIWTIPDNNTCQEMYYHPEKVPDNEEWLLRMVRAFMEGHIYHDACREFKIPLDVDTEKPPELRIPSKKTA